MKCKWKCSICGKIITTTSPFWDEKSRKNISEPRICGCEKKDGLLSMRVKFELVDFEKCLFTVMPKGAKIVDRDGKTITMYEDKEAEERENSAMLQDQEDAEEITD